MTWDLKYPFRSLGIFEFYLSRLIMHRFHFANIFGLNAFFLDFSPQVLFEWLFFNKFFTVSLNFIPRPYPSKIARNQFDKIFLFRVEPFYSIYLIRQLKNLPTLLMSDSNFAFINWRAFKFEDISSYAWIFYINRRLLLPL